MVITLFKKNTVITLLMWLKHNLSGGQIQNIFECSLDYNLSVHQLLNFNWSEIYVGGGEVEGQEQQIIIVFHSLCQVHSCNIFAGSKAKQEYEAVDRQGLLKLRV